MTDIAAVRIRRRTTHRTSRQAGSDRNRPRGTVKCRFLRAGGGNGGRCRTRGSGCPYRPPDRIREPRSRKDRAAPTENASDAAVPLQPRASRPGLRRRSASSARVASNDNLLPYPVNRTAALRGPGGRRAILPHLAKRELCTELSLSEHDGKRTWPERGQQRRMAVRTLDIFGIIELPVLARVIR